MEDILKIAAGIVLALLIMEGITYLKNAPARARAERKRRELHHALEHVAHDIIKNAEKAQAEEQSQRRKPAQKKAPVKKPVATTKKPVTTKKGK